MIQPKIKKKSESLWNLQFWIGKRLVETKVYGQPYATCKKMKKIYEAMPNYRDVPKGYFKIIPNVMPKRMKMIISDQENSDLYWNQCVNSK